VQELPKKKVTPFINSTPKTLSEEEIKEHKKPFGASPKIEKQTTELNTQQETFLKNLTISYNKLTAGSKAYTQKHRAHMSDPRVVSGFKPFTKELVYPLVIEKSSGNKLWDVDGNEYLDTLNGFGSCLFGHQPDFIKKALHYQIEQGFEVGPQHPLAGEVCELLCELTQHERAALCNTGSEAVLGAMRIARTVTGRSLIVAFSRSYHGINDEVIVRGSRMKKTFPAAAGIMPEAVQNMLILDYGTEESLQIIRDRGHEIAAVLVEPIQSRRPDFQPVEFLKEIREITKTSNITLIFDEIITGFRMHLQGMQGMYGIKADIATYGKVIGGGISIGAILGSSKYMDALDGGFWQFGDDSIPEVGVTYFAGTFVRHPLALATTKASLLHLKENSPELQDNLANMTERLASELNLYFKNHSLPIEIHYFRSLWRLSFLEEVAYAELIFVLMRSKGIHVWDGFPCYITEAYKEDDISQIIKSFIESIEELTEVGIFQSDSKNKSHLSYKSLVELNTPPKSGAKLGLDEEGNPAWFVVDKKKNNGYLKIDL
jgi:glutamate-1-semialdehyde aminotransferase